MKNTMQGKPRLGEIHMLGKHPIGPEACQEFQFARRVSTTNEIFPTKAEVRLAYDSAKLSY